MSEPLHSTEFNDDISVTEGNKNELILFLKRDDEQSFIELLKMNRQTNNRTLVTLNSAINAKKFINRFQNYDGKIFLCLEGNRMGDAATLKIQSELNGRNIKDIRNLYEISQSGNKDLSDYLQNKLQKQQILMV